MRRARRARHRYTGTDVVRFSCVYPRLVRPDITAIITRPGTDVLIRNKRSPERAECIPHDLPLAALAQDVLKPYPLSAATHAFLDRAGPMFIDGRWVMAKSGRTLDVYDPASARVIARVADADKPDVDLA